MLTFTTSSGSKYELDLDNKTWRRVRHASESNLLRTEGGVYIDYNIQVGERGVIICPPLEEGDFRVISTSKVVDVQFIQETPKAA